MKTINIFLKKLAVTFSLVLAVMSCSKEGGAICQKDEMAMEMSTVTTKSQLSDKLVLWQTGDAISVFDGNENCRFVSTEDGLTATFYGEASTRDYYYTLYPYNSAATISNGVISTELPAEQPATSGSFAAGANLSMAKTVLYKGNHSGFFRNAGCYLKLIVTSPGAGVYNITASAIGGEKLSGPVNVQLDSKEIPVVSANGGNSYVKMISSNGSVGVGEYYLVLLPTQLSKGLKITVNGNSREICSFNISSLKKVDRNFVYAFTFSEDWLTGSLEIEGLGDVITVPASGPEVETSWNNWTTKADVLNKLKSARTAGKTYFSMFKFFNYESSENITGYKTTNYGLPYIYGIDFYTAFGTYFPQASRLEDRDNIKAVVQKAWRSNRSIPSFTWHLESPYAVYSDFYEQQGQKMGCRYVYGRAGIAENFPAKYRYQVRDILNNRQVDTLGIGRLGDWFDTRVREVASFINELVDEEGHPIPIIFRLWHEVESGWAWWQVNSYNYTNCSKDEYIALYQLTVGKFRTYCPNAQIMFAFCTDRHFESKSEYLTCYPGDDYVDILGYDDYEIGDASDYLIPLWALNEQKNRAKNVTAIANEKGKVAAIFETNNVYSGDEALNFYNDWVQKILKGSDIGLSLFQVWSESENTTEKKTAMKEFIRQDNIIFGRLAPQE